MNEDQTEARTIGPLAAALRQETETWTSACLPPEQVIALAEHAVTEPEATRLMAHVTLCARCRREYAETVELLQLAEDVRALEGQAEAASPTVTPAPPAAPVRTRGRPFWQEWFTPTLRFALGAAAAGLLVYVMFAAPAQRQRDRLASSLTEREAARVRLEQELATLKRQNQGEVGRLAARLKAQEVRMARLDQDAAVLQQLPLPTAEWILSRGDGTVRGGGNGGGPAPEIALIRPVDTAVSVTTPTLEARPVAGVTNYQVSLEMADSTEEVPSLKPLSSARWQVTRPLQPGKVYQWAVSAQGETRPLRSPLVRFYVLTEADKAEIEKARKAHASNPLALGALYARLGLKAEAEQQFRAALKADSKHPVATRWLNEIAK